MSWSSPLRVLSVCGLWLAIQTGCGGNPSVVNPDTGTSGGTSAGGSDTGNGGRLIIGTGGEGNEGNEGGEGATGPTYVCGNGELEPGEFCEDGNTEDADGCSADCTTVSSEYDCSKVGEPCVQVVICGNGVIEGDEVCDDGNTADDDGCAGDCREVEAGYGCVRPGKACVELSVCGNGVRQRGEQCDDFNVASGDGCDDKCQTEPDYFCITPGEPCKPQVCGNGERTPGEGCDDGNKVGNDGCSADCTSVETGWHCNTVGCKPQCGDGVKVGAEECDDKDAISGDGCSSACKVEPFYQCAGAPSVCSKIPSVCGNGKVEPGELCDTKAAGGANCKPTCNGYIPVVMTSDCKNGVLEAGEECLPDPGKGCNANCKVEPGYTCPQPGVCFLLPTCGDGTVNPGEACDDKNIVGGDGCDATCKVEMGYTCVGLGPSLCVKPNCGNGTIEGTEKCDDKNAVNGDGCTACAVDSGYACPTPGAACIAKCGDGVKKPSEACDDGNKVSGDGCNSGCKIEFGYKCPTQGVKCVAAVCGDASNPLDAGEGCDDGNKIAGDGCGPTCQPEPEVTVGPDPVVKVFCGDGLKTGAEACDDGNTTDDDGCESDCTVTPGWQCTAKLTLPTTLDMRVRYRDFKSANALTPGGHPDFQYNTFQQVLGITGAACKSANAAACGRLDADGKPVLVRTNQQNQATGYNTGTGIMSAATFGLWYRDTNPNGVVGYDGAIQIKPITKTLTLTQQGGATSEVYAYSNGDFYPITVAESFKDGGNNNIGNIGAEVAQCDNGNGVRNQVNACGGCDAACKARDYGFTSELRYFFQYKGGERLTFTGDDDVWVYVNGKLAVDLGGLHSQLSGQVVLGDDGNGTAATDSNCSANGVAFADLPDPAGGCYSAAEQSNNLDQRFGLTKGGVYEIVLFHAERHSNASNFRLTLAGFLAPRSSCDTICGDGMVVGDELCDEGVNNSDTASGACTTTCTARNYCGDGVRQLPGEACDNGTNTDIYKTAASAPSVCAPGCKTPASCGDGALQVGQGEQCDKGSLNNDSAYGKNECKTNCKLGGFCGDSLTQSAEGEVCDLGANNGKTYGAGSCGYDCKAGLRCGDGIINGPADTEQCDDGILNGSIGSHCSAACKVVPFCGDGTKGANEACDWGPFATDNPTEYGGCSSMCGLGPTCGDGMKNGPEECDDGATNNDTVYGGCTKSCALGPRCGDGVKQAEQGEACDNGFNADDYDDPRTAQAECGKNCTPPPFCGDNAVQPAYELCDDGASNSDTAYEGCTSTCEFGPYCGDGDVSGPETCDDGFDNVAYQAEKGGCSYECQPAPYCGDGERNGSEQCDLGTDENTGEYGGCNADCTFSIRCGDQRIDKGEECDDGPTGSLSCTSACKKRPVVVQ